MKYDRELIAERNPDLLLLEPATFDAAIVGVVEQAGGFEAVAYDAEKCIRIIAKDNRWSRDDAIEWFYANTASAYVGPHTPVFLHSKV